MDVDESKQLLNRPRVRLSSQPRVGNRGNFQPNYQQNSIPKRANANTQVSTQPQQKMQRINNINENHFLE